MQKKKELTTFSAVVAARFIFGENGKSIIVHKDVDDTLKWLCVIVIGMEIVNSIKWLICMLRLADERPIVTAPKCNAIQLTPSRDQVDFSVCLHKRSR